MKEAARRVHRVCESHRLFNAVRRIRSRVGRATALSLPDESPTNVGRKRCARSTIFKLFIMFVVPQSNVLGDSLLERLGVTAQDIEDFKENHCGLCNVENSRLSELLFAQLAQFSKYRLLNTFAVTDVIQKL